MPAAPRVVALDVRGQSTQAKEANHTLERWSARAAHVPLVVLDAAGCDRGTVFQAALDALRRAEQPSLLTVVVPDGGPAPG